MRVSLRKGFGRVNFKFIRLYLVMVLQFIDWSLFFNNYRIFFQQADIFSKKEVKNVKI